MHNKKAMMKVTFRAATQEMLKSSTLVLHVYIIFGMDGFILYYYHSFVLYRFIFKIM